MSKGYFSSVCGLLLVACSPNQATGPQTPDQPITNRIHLSPEMMGNLGITFADVERGALQIFLEVPGQLVAPDNRKWTIRSPSAGRVALYVSRWATVQQGDVVAELTTPDLVELQTALFDALNESARVQASSLAGRAEMQPLSSRALVLEQAVEDATQRLAESEALAEQTLSVAEASSRRVEELTRLQQNNALSNRELHDANVAHATSLEAALTAATRRDDLRKRLADLKLEAVRAANLVATHESEMGIFERREQAAELTFNRRLRELAALTGRPQTELIATSGDRPLWQEIETVNLRSPGNGRVVDLFIGGGEWLGNAQPILQVVDATELVFRGQVPESDLGRIPQQAPVAILPAVEGLAQLDSQLSGLLPVADEIARTIQIEARIPNPGERLPTGLSAVARVLLRAKAREEVLIPEDCLARDGLEWVVFRRDPAEPSTVIRLPVELGDRAGDTVEVLSGLLQGDEIVRRGVHQLVHAGLGKAPPGTHIHADGTSHADHK